MYVCNTHIYMYVCDLCRGTEETSNICCLQERAGCPRNRKRRETFHYTLVLFKPPVGGGSITSFPLTHHSPVCSLTGHVCIQLTLRVAYHVTLMTSD